MNSKFRITVPLLLILSLLVRISSAEEKKQGLADMSYSGLAVVIPVEEDTLEGAREARILKEILQKAEKDKAAVVIFDLNVGGGDILRAKRWVDEVADLEITTIAYVNRTAFAEGVALACASDRIIMAKGGQIGLAPPVITTGKDVSEAAQKLEIQTNTSRAVAMLESLCARKGYNAEVARAFADSSREVKIGEDVISKEGEILTLSATRATKEYDGNPLFAEAIVEQLDEVVAGLDAELKQLEVNLEDFESNTKVTPLVADPGEGEKEDPKEKESEEEEDREKYVLKEGEESYEGKIVVIEIDQDDLVNSARFDFMKRTLSRASDEGASAVIFDINTPGGLAWDTGQIITGEMQRMDCPTYAYVNSNAISAGALIACVCDKIYMAPGSNIGAAAVVNSNYSEMGEVEREKLNSAFSAIARGAAKGKGGKYRSQVLQCFIVLEEELVIDGEVIDSKDKLLSLDAEEATKVYNGEPLLAEGIVKSIEDLIAAEGLEGEIVRAKPTGMEWFAELVSKYAAFLIMLAVVGAYMEFKTPGFGIAGLISVLAFAVFFFGHNMAGALIGYEEVVVIVLGVILLIVEFFIVPGTMIFGALGLLCIVGGLVYVMAQLGWGFRGVDGFDPSIADFGEPIFNVTVGMAGAVILIAILMRYLPETSLFKWLILENSVGGAATVSGPDLADGGKEEESFVGRTGVTKTPLKPAGKGDFDGDLLEIVSDGGYVQAGERVRVVEQKGTRVVVEQLD